jgi:hypothetical protein
MKSYSQNQLRREVGFMMAQLPNYIALIDRLSNGHITKHKEIYEINYIEAILNLLVICIIKTNI